MNARKKADAPRRPWLWVIAGALGLALVVGARRVSTTKTERNEAAEAVATVRACLYGAPLKAGELGSQRLSAIEMCGPRDPARPLDWPRGCREPVRRLWRALSRLGPDESHPRFGAALKHARIAGEWKHEDIPWLAGSERPLIDDLEAGLRRAELPQVASVTAQPLCTAHPEHSLSELVALGGVDAFRAAEERVPGRALRALWPGGRGKSSLACWFAPGGEPVARCGAPDVENIASLLGADEALEDVYAWDPLWGEPKRHRVVNSAGTTLLELAHMREHGWARADGGVDVLDFEGRLVAAEAGGKVATFKTPERATGVRPGLLLFSAEVVKAESWDKPSTVRAGVRHLGADGAMTGEPIELGTLTEPDLVRACRTADGGMTLAFLAKGGERVKGHADFRSQSVTVFFPDGKGGYQPGVTGSCEFPQVSGISARVDDATRFGCTASGTPRWLWLRGNAIHDFSCGPKACVERVSRDLVVAVDELRGLAFAPLAEDKVLLAYFGNRKGRVEGHLPIVRARLATLDAAPDAQDHLLLSGEKHGGPPSMEGLSAFGRGEVGWVALRANRLLYAFRTRPDGSFEAVRPDPARK